MGYIYAYAPDSDDCQSLGLCGALMPTSAEFTLEAGSFPELTINHPKDEIGKWKALQNGVILRAPCPVRYSPDFKNATEYVDTYQVWTVKKTATSDDLKLTTKPKNGKKSGAIPAGATVTVTNVDSINSMMKIKASVKVGKRTKNYCGWIADKVLDSKISEVSIENPGHASGEKFAESYAIRDQLFRIYDVKLAETSGGQITVKARHIVYDLLGNLTTYHYDDGDVACSAACTGILANAVFPHQFSIYSDIASARSGFEARNVNPIEALTKKDTGVLAKWGAEVTVDNYDIYVLRRAGSDRGYQLRYGQNITGVNYEVDISDVADGVRCQGEDKDGNPLYLDGTYVDGKYMYNSGKYELDPGYKFLKLPDGTIDGTVIVRDSMDTNSIVVPKIFPNTVSDAKIDGKKVKIDLALLRLATGAYEKFEDGCDDPKITLTVNFTELGDTEEYAQYRHLNSLFVYDTVRVIYDPLEIDVSIDLKSISWDCITDRVKSATFGEIEETSSSVASWNISSVDGGKINAGTVTAASLASGSISGVAIQDGAIIAGHLQAGSVNTKAISSDSIIAKHISSGAVEADKIASHCIGADQIDATSVSAAIIKTDQLSAKVAEIADASIGSASIDYAQIKDASVETLFTRDANADKYYINKLGVTSAQIENLMVGQLVFKATDNKYYTIDATTGEDGSVSFAPVEYTGEIDADTGVTSDGSRYVFDSTVNVSDLYAENIHAADALITRLNVDKLYANDAFISKLTTTNIFADGVLTISAIRQAAVDAQTVAGAASAAASDAQTAAVSAQGVASEAAQTAASAHTIAEDVKGSAIVSVVTHYLATNLNKNVTRETPGWTETVQVKTRANKYVWMYYTYKLCNGTTVDSDPSINGTLQYNFKDVNALFTVSTSPSTNTGTEWVNDVPAIGSNQYIWSKLECVDASGATRYSEEKYEIDLTDAARIDTIQDAIFDSLDGINHIYVSATQPNNLVTNDVWLSSSSQHVYRAVVSSGQLELIDITDKGFAKTLLKATNAADMSDSKLQTYCSELLQTVSSTSEVENPQNGDICVVCTSTIKPDFEEETGSVVGNNLLDNWYFSDPVNSRGAQSYSSGNTIDRWWLNTSNATVSLTTSGITLTTSSTNSSPALLIQDISASKTSALSGKKVTVSVFADVPAGSKFYLTDVGGFADVHRDVQIVDGITSWTFTAQDVSSAKVALWSSMTSNKITVYAIKMETGEHQTLVHKENGVWYLSDAYSKADETEKCKWLTNSGQRIENDYWYNRLYSVYRYNGSSWVEYFPKSDAYMTITDGFVHLISCDGTEWCLAKTQVGDLWCNVNDNTTMYRYNGAAWYEVSSSFEHISEQIDSINTTAEVQDALINGIRAKTQYIDIDSSGLHIKNNDKSSEMLLTSGSMQIKTAADKGTAYSEFSSLYARFGNYKLRLTNDGGMAFIYSEEM